MIPGRWFWSATGLVVVMAALSGCQKEQPQPSFNYDLGADGAVLVLPASPRHNDQLLDGQAEWRPFRNYEPPLEDSAVDGETEDSAGMEETEADIREMLDESEKEREAKLMQARRDADRIVDEGLAAIDKEIDEIYERARAETQRAVEARIEEGRALVDERRQASDETLPRAVDHLVMEFERSTLRE